MFYCEIDPLWPWLPLEDVADDAAYWPADWPGANEANEANLVSHGDIYNIYI